MPITKTCVECGKEFETKPYKKDIAKYCSRECQNKHKQGKRNGEWIKKICPSCGKEFETMKSRNKKYCSDKCNQERNEKYMIYNCDICNKEMRIKKSSYQNLLDGKQKTITCSRECANKTKHTGHDISCLNCGKIFYRRKYHIDRQNNQFCSNECQLEYQHKQKFEIRKCETCGKEFECSKLSTQRFCSQKCNSEWQKTVIGESNPRFTSEKILCEYCGKEHYVRQHKLKNNQHNFCSDLCRQSWYAEVWSQRDEWRKESRCRMLDLLNSGKIGNVNSKPQKIIDALLEDKNISFEREYSIKYYSVDNYLTHEGLMIEVQGDYWHGNPLKFYNYLTKTQYDRISKDKAKHTYIKNKYNIETLYLWEYDIQRNLELCEKLIDLYIERNGNLENYHSFNYYINETGKLSIKDEIIIPYQDMNVKQYKHLLKEIS